MTLAQEIQLSSSKISTEAYSMSVGELISLYEGGEIEIHPEFQRVYRWSFEQKSSLIESILLGIPLPSIFVAQRDDGVWDVIDGLQRLSTIFQLIGILKDDAGAAVTPLVLTKTKYLPSLQGVTWASLGMAERLSIKRAKMDVKIIKKQSDASAKYELFQRLNTGGSALSEQEVRNCILISIGNSQYEALEELATLESFCECCSLTERSTGEQYHMELVLRFVLLYTATESDIRQIVDIGQFLTDKMSTLAQTGSLFTPECKRDFKATFEYLQTTLGSDAFRKYSATKDKFEGGFLISAFEALALGLGYRSYRGAPTLPGMELLELVRSMWSSQTFLQGIGSGKRASERMPVSIPFGRTIFAG